ncbi:MAG TPA: CBS domain-containing protein [Nitrososphaerales archaeon]|nr:CBS domain-containing protein [Nitrososphaerales archaeon]
MVLYAKDILAKDFLSFSKSTSVLETVKAMKATRHGFAIVGSPENPEGIVTEWDVISKVVAEGKDPAAVLLGDVMTTELVMVKANEGIAAVAKVMSDRGVRRMLVKDGDRVIGYITEKTVLANLEDYVDKVSAQISRLQAPWF